MVGSAQSNIDLSEFVLNAAHQHCRRTRTIRRGPRRVSPGKLDQEEGCYKPHQECVCVACERPVTSNSHGTVSSSRTSATSWSGGTGGEEETSLGSRCISELVRKAGF